MIIFSVFYSDYKMSSTEVMDIKQVRREQAQKYAIYYLQRIRLS